MEGKTLLLYFSWNYFLSYIYSAVLALSDHSYCFSLPRLYPVSPNLEHPILTLKHRTCKIFKQIFLLFQETGNSFLAAAVLLLSDAPHLLSKVPGSSLLSKLLSSLLFHHTGAARLLNGES